jgi:lysophospholipid acyltransferase (LPLAT)-like uncharacterized protein
VARVSAEKAPSKRSARIAAVGVWLVRLLGWTWRVRVSHDGDLRQFLAEGRPFIFSLWHGNLLPLLYHHRHDDVAILISEHGDGEIIARIAMSLGYRTVRGSSSRGAARALLGLVRELQAGHSLAITPDGPRGPAKSIAPGVIAVSQRACAPIVPIAAGARSAWRLKSWDAFLIPKPFARVHVAYGSTVFSVREEIDNFTAEAERLRKAMGEAEQRAND